MKATRLTPPFLFTGLFALVIAGCGGSDQKLNANNDQNGGSTGGNTSAASAEEINVAVTPENIAKGKAIYMRTCTPCHGESGKGDGPAAMALNPKPADHTNGTYMDKLSDDHIYKTIRQGGGQFGKPTMPPNPQISDEDAKALVAFIRSISNTRKS